MRLLFSCTIIIIQFACNDAKKSEISASQILNETIESSTKFIEQKNWETYASLDANLEDPKTRYKTEIWNPHARAIKYLSDSIFNYISLIKEKAKENEKKDASVYLHELYNRLLSYQSSLLNINTELTTTFKNLSFVSNFNADTIQLNYSNFENVFLSAPTQEAYLGLFNVLENKIRRIENRMIAFCFMKIGDYNDSFTIYQPLFVQDKNIVSPGDSIEIIVGMGKINPTNKVIINILGDTVLPGSNGITSYKFSTHKIKGRHSVPLTISFSDLKGERQTISKTITYTVR